MSMTKKSILAELKGLKLQDYDIQIRKFYKDAEGDFLWLYNFEGGGFNDVWAKTKEQAVAKASKSFSTLIPKADTFRKCTWEEYQAQNRMGNMMSF